MSLTKNYDPTTAEPRLEQAWQAQGIYQFDPHGAGPVYSIDTPSRIVAMSFCEPRSCRLQLSS